MEVGTVHGIDIDVCDDHGMWLDVGELERIAFKKYQKGHRKRQAKLSRIRNKARWEGIVRGLSSLNRD
jgi:Zn-finger nucleic acid-binding protein